MLIVSVVIAVAINGSTPHIADHGNPLEQNVDLFPEQELMPSNLNKTIMVYLVASDLESQSGAASLDIIEMLESDVDTEKNNILIYTGGTKQWQIENISSTENCIYKLENGSLVLQESYKSSNMGSSETLSRFLKYGMTNFSADKYGLILWNHGAGPMIGCGVDEVYNDILEIPELASALSEAGLGENNKLEFLGFDACLMGSIETAWSIKDYANYLIASQETEPGTGWDYSFLKFLNYFDSGNDIGKAIIDTYFEANQKYVEQYPQMKADLTLSCLDLSKIEKVENSINVLFASVDENILNGAFAQVSRCRSNTKSFGKFSSIINYDLVDLVHLIELLSNEYEKESKTLLLDLDELIYYSKSNIEHADGISIYHPYDNMEQLKIWVEAYKKLNFSAEYTKYIRNFGNILLNPYDSTINSLSKNHFVFSDTQNGTELKMQLTAEQLKTFSKAKYFIIKQTENNEFLFIYSGLDVNLDKNGALVANYNNKSVFAVDDKSGEVSEFPITMYQIDDGSDNLKYYASCVFFDQGSDNISEWRGFAVNWQIAIENGTPNLLGAYVIDDKEELIPQKQLLNYKDFTHIQFIGFSRTLTRNDSGELLPFFEWQSTGKGMGSEFTVKNGFHLECREIPNKEDYFAMFVIKDTNGNQYASELLNLK